MLGLALATAPLRLRAGEEWGAAATEAGQNMQRGKHALRRVSHGSSPIPVYCHMQFEAPKLLSGEILAYTRGIFPEQSLRMVPAMLLGFWGYPNFPGISETDPISIFVFAPGEGGGLRWVACAKLNPDGPVSSATRLQSIKSVKVGPWTFLSKDAVLLKELSDRGQFRALVKLAERSAVNDFRLDCLTPAIQDIVKHYEKTALDNLARSGDINGNFQAISLLNFFLNFANQLKECTIRGDFTEREFEGQMVLTAYDQSDLATLFNAPVAAIDVSPATRLIPAGGVSQVVLRYSPEWTSRVLQLAIDGLFFYGQQGIGDVSERAIYNLIEDIFYNYTGAMAAQVSIDGDGREVVRHLWCMGSFPEQLADWVDFGYTQLAPVVISSLVSLPPNSEFTVSTEVDRCAFIHRGMPVIGVKVNFSGIAGTVRPGQRSGTIDSQKRYYYCALKNFVAMANGEDAIRGLIDDVLKGRLREPSLAEVVGPGEGIAAQMLINPLQSLRLIYPTLPPATGDSSNNNLSAQVKLGENAATLTFNVNSATVGDVVRALHQLEVDALPQNSKKIPNEGRNDGNGGREKKF